MLEFLFLVGISLYFASFLRTKPKCTKLNDFKESYPPTLHCAHLLLLLSGVSLQAIPYLGMNIHHGRDRKILSSIVEFMEVSDSDENFHISD